MRSFTINSIEIVCNERKTPIDDYWGKVLSKIGTSRIGYPGRQVK
ncbi:hypothetical protein [Peribacillus saganii]|nr:hypothetical protein [Peribacillus saganii]